MISDTCSSTYALYILIFDFLFAEVKSNSDPMDLLFSLLLDVPMDKYRRGKYGSNSHVVKLILKSCTGTNSVIPVLKC